MAQRDTYAHNNLHPMTTAPQIRKIAFLTGRDSPVSAVGVGSAGGHVTYMRELTAAIARTGVKCITYVNNPQGETNATQNISPNNLIVTVGTSARNDDAIDNMTLFGEKVASLIEPDVQIVHSHYWLGGVAANIVSKRIGVPHIITYHTLNATKAKHGEPSNATRGHYEKLISQSVERICYSCPNDRLDISQAFDAVDSKLSHIPPGVDHSIFFPGNTSEAETFLGLQSCTTLMYVGRIERFKGLHILLETVNLLKHTDIQLIVIGVVDSDTDYGREILTYVKDNELERIVTFIGAIEHESLARYYRAADIVIVPSEHESFGLVALEAMACGTPVVTTTSFSEVPTHNTDGCVVVERSAEGILEGIRKTVDRRHKYPPITDVLRKYSDAYSWDFCAQSTLDLYRSLCKPNI